jgi:hypothetical protein
MQASTLSFPTAFTLLISLSASAKAQASGPATAVAEADRLAMLYNWPRALPLYADAEREFRRLNDPKGVLETRLGWIRAQANATRRAAEAQSSELHLESTPPNGRHSNLMIPTGPIGRTPRRS